MEAYNKEALPRKLRLSGADCFHLVLDRHAEIHGAGGNVMRKVFHFGKHVPAEKIEGILKRSPVIHWMCNIELVKGRFFKAPYWKYRDKGNEIIMRVHQPGTEKSIPQNILDRDINISSERFIEADMLYYPSGSCAFVLSWNHMLLDARGTSFLFEHLGKLFAGEKTGAGNFFPLPVKGFGIIRHVRNMYKVKSFIQHCSRPPLSSIAATGRSRKSGTGYRHMSFGPLESEKIGSNAAGAGARFGPSHFYIACCARVIHQYNRENGRKGDTWLPVPYDGRRKGASGPVISNHVNFVFYRLGDTDLEKTGVAVKSLSAQMAAQINAGMPQRYNLFLDMMRHIPLRLYHFLINRAGEGSFASFLYTTTGDYFNGLEEIFGEPLEGLALVPALIHPPGLTFVFVKHKGLLNVDMAYAPGVISDNDILLIEQKLKEVLLADQ